MDPVTLLLLLGVGFFAVKTTPKKPAPSPSPKGPQQRPISSTPVVVGPSTPVEALPVRSTDPEIPPPPAPLSAFPSALKYKANLSAAAAGSPYVFLGDDGVPQIYVWKLTPAQAAAIAARINAGDPIGDALIAGLRKIAGDTFNKLIPGAGTVVAGNIAGAERVTPTQVLQSNQALREVATIVVPNLDIGAPPLAKQIDVSLQEMADAEDDTGSGARRKKVV